METVLKFDEIILTKELNDRFRKIGEVFEVANVLNDAFLLREKETKIAVGVVSFSDFEKHFVHKDNFQGWTNWTHMIGFDGHNDIIYRTNRKKVQMRFLTDKVSGESCCHKEDDFNLSLGLRIAYMRCVKKSLAKRKAEHEKQLKEISNKLVAINRDIIDVENVTKDLINSLES